MSAFIEVMIIGDRRAYIEASSVMGIITSPGMAGDGLASPDAPISLIMRGGDVLEGVYGVSPNRLILNMAGVRHLQRKDGRLCVVAYIDKQDDLDAQLAEILHG